MLKPRGIDLAFYWDRRRPRSPETLHTLGEHKPAETPLWVRSETLRLNNLRAEQARETGTPGPEGSIGKVLSAELNKDAFAFALGLTGMAGTLFDAGYAQDQTRPALEYDSLVEYFLRVRANSIEGGTTEVMRNILGERVLGLPGDVRVDKDVAWNTVPRN